MIPDEAVEAAARGQYENDGLAWEDDYTPDWACEDDSLQESYRASARAALEAAAPHMAPASERAMQDIKGLMDEYFSDTSRIVEVDVVMRLARIVGTYDMERIGEPK